MRYGEENIIGFHVHLDESSPHVHALIVPVGQRAKSGHECVMWSAKFGKTRYEYGQILREMHTSLYEEVGVSTGWNVVIVLKAGTLAILVNAIIFEN